MDEVNEKMYRLESEIEVKQEKDENIVEMCEEIEIKEEVEEMNKFGFTEQNAENLKRLVKTEEAEQKSCGGNIETFENKNMDEVNENMYRLESEIKVKQEKDENIVEMYEEIEIKEEVEINELKDFFEQNAENVKRSVKTGEAEQKLSGANTGGGPSGGNPLLNSLSDAVAGILGPDSPSIIGISGLTSYDSVTDDSCEDTIRTCTNMILPPQSSQESQPSGSMLIHRPTSVDWGQPMTKKAIDLKITELQSNIKFHNAQMEAARAQMEAAKAQMELQKTKIEVAKEQLQKYHEMKEGCT